MKNHEKNHEKIMFFWAEQRGARGCKWQQGVARDRKGPRSTQKHPEASRSTQKHSEAI